MYRISLLTGDGIGPDLSEAVVVILDAIHDRCGVGFDVQRLPAGDAAIQDTGVALPDATMRQIRDSDACLKAPVGESAADVIVRLRRTLDLYANIRPAKSYTGVSALRDDIDMVIVRENTEDLYIRKEFQIDGGAVALRVITERASRRIAVRAFEMARRRNMMKVTCVHKSNVMSITDGLFSSVCAQVASEYPDVIYENMYVDACAMNLVRRPEQFDVILTTNLFGDILSDESSQVVGGLGMAPAANIGDDFALFEPVHGAAFDIAQLHVANPSSFILSARMMLEWLSSTRSDTACAEAARVLESALAGVVASGVGTRDIGGTLNTMGFAEQVASEILAH